MANRKARSFPYEAFTLKTRTEKAMRTILIANGAKITAVRERNKRTKFEM